MRYYFVYNLTNMNTTELCRGVINDLIWRLKDHCVGFELWERGK